MSNRDESLLKLHVEDPLWYLKVIFCEQSHPRWWPRIAGRECFAEGRQDQSPHPLQENPLLGGLTGDA